MDCGKEMTRTHEEPEQQAGLGGGDDPALCRRVARHRLNPAAYRAETLDMAKELAEIEEERMRLEKEEYLVRQSDIHFYDFDEMKALTQRLFRTFLNFKLRRRRRRDATLPRRPRRGRQSVYASRE